MVPNPGETTKDLVDGRIGTRVYGFYNDNMEAYEVVSVMESVGE